MTVRTARLPLAAVAAFLMLLPLYGCGSPREALGLDKQSPDEFAVVTRAPLSLPPDYGLRPPKPGAQRPQEETVNQSARAILVRDVAVAPSGNLPDSTAGERALLTAAGALNPDPTIRQKVNRDSSILAGEDDGFIDSLIFWQDRPEPGTVIDADKEARRLRETAALGDPPTKGRSPRIERRPKGWLEGIFN